nr:MULTISPECIES: DUF3800 domain-containing protein [Corynebacterium]
MQERNPLEPPKETNCGQLEFKEREETAMREALNRIARYADTKKSNVLVMIDQVNEKSRIQRLPAMYAHILGRSSEHPEMRRLIEPPMHIDSELSTNIQFADWICALVKRAIDYQLVEDSRYHWVPEAQQLKSARGLFTYESKIHLHQHTINDLNHSDILNSERSLFDSTRSSSLDKENMQKLERIRAATFKSSN